MDQTKFNILDAIADGRLTRAKRKNVYFCPNCGAPKLSINPRTGAPSCFGCNDISAVIRELTKNDRDAYSEEQRRQWREENDARERSYRGRLLDIDTRNQQYSSLLQQLQLNSEHCEHLEKQRGLTAEEIKLAVQMGFRSNAPGWKIFGAKANLAGVYRAGDELLLGGGTGLMIPYRDSQGRIQGIQIRSDAKTDRNGDELPKYYWLSSASRGGCGPQLKESGKVPLAYWRHPEATEISDVFYSEGGLKSFIIACQVWKVDKDILVIGAAGGNFTGLDESIAQLPVIHCLLPDAGSALNINIQKQYQTLRQLCPSILIADWKHWADKSKLDPDEFLVAGGEFGIGEWDDFLALEPLPPTPPPLEAEQLELIAAEQHDYWRSLAHFTPTEVVEQQFLNIQWLDGYLTVTASPTGTGKTRQMISWTRENSLQIVNVGSRNTLMINTSARFNDKDNGAGVASYHIHEKDAELMLRDTNVAIHLCIDSIMKVPVHVAAGRIVTVDETVSVLFHALHGSKQSIRVKMLERFDDIAAVCGGMILLDANMNDWVVAAIHERCPHLKLRKIKNTYRSTRWNVTLLEGAINAEGNVSSIDKTPIIQHLLFKAMEGHKMAIVSDSQKMLEVLDNLLDKQADNNGLPRPKSLRVDGEVDVERIESVNEFLEDANKYLVKHDVQILMLSPTALSGLDVSQPKWFEYQYCLFSWIDTDSQIQMVGRIRHCGERLIALPTYASVSDKMFRNAHNLDTLTDKQQQYIRQIARVHCRGAADPNDLEQAILEMFRENRTDWEAIANTFTIKHWYERHNMQRCLIERLEEAGHIVNMVQMEGNAEIKAQCKEERSKMLDGRSLAIYNALVMASKSQAMEILQKFGATIQDRRSAEKTLLLHYLPGIQTTASWTPDLVRKIVFDEAEWRGQIERFFLLQHPEIAANIALGFWDDAAYRATSDIRFFVPDKMKDREMLIWALTELKIMPIIQFLLEGGEVTNSSPMVLALVKRGTDARIILALQGKSPKKQVEVGKPIQYLSDLLAMVGVAMKSKQHRVEGKVVRSYALDLEKFNATDRQDLLACITNRFAERDWYEPFKPVTSKEISLNCGVSDESPQLRKIFNDVTGPNSDSEGISANSEKNDQNSDVYSSIATALQKDLPPLPDDFGTETGEGVLQGAESVGDATTTSSPTPSDLDWGSPDWSQADQAALFDASPYESDSLYGDYFQ